MARRTPKKMPARPGRRQFEILGGAATLAGAALIISIFVMTSLSSVLIQANQYAAVIAAVLVDLTNGDRAANQIRGLTINQKLVEAAQMKADDMAARGYFAHIGPDGKDSWHWFRETGYKFAYAGENLAVDFSDSGDVERAWMNSPSHRKNLLDSNFTEIGIATAAGFYQGRPTIFVAQMFGAPASADVILEPIESTVPEDPEEPAVASATLAPAAVQVLGETASVDETVAAVTGAAPTRVVEIKAPRYSTLFDRIMTSPKMLMGWAFYLIGMIIIVSLFITTGFEFKTHHTQKFIAAGVLFVFMSASFVALDMFMLSTPTLSDTAAHTAAVGAAQ
jgi:hypothetical protein